jgi:nucleotide-binding universal stress UspA family protein
MYNRILVPVDGSSTSRRGLDEAIKLAQGSGASLRIVHVVNEFVMDTAYAFPQFYEQVIAVMRDSGAKLLAEAEAYARERGVDCHSELHETVGGRAADAIVAQAKEWPADLIVLGTHGRRGLRRLALGSDAELVLRLSPVPVLMVRDTPEPA